MKQIYSDLLKEIQRKDENPMVLATLVHTKGSTPQVPGSSAIFVESDILYGTLGGGILEAEAQQASRIAIQTHRNALLDFSLTADIHEDKGGICGGEVRVLIDAVPGRHFGEFLKMQETISLGDHGALITFIIRSDSEDIDIRRTWVAAGDASSFCSGQNTWLAMELHEAIRQSRPVYLTDTGRVNAKFPTGVFIEPVNPFPHLLIVGAGHVGRALTHLAHLLDFRVTVLDTRKDVAIRKYLPDADEIMVGDIREIMDSLAVSRNTYIVIASQGHQHDALALKACIKRNPAYIGLMGSRRKVRLMKEKFVDEGWALRKELDGIYTPVGLDISSVTVQEIALSIAAELVKVRSENALKLRKSGIWTVILAAGKSKRMGKQKMLMPYEGTTIIETVIGNAVRSGSDRVIVVLGSHKEDISERIMHFPIDTVVNERFGEGMLSSIQCGIGAIPQKVSAFIIMLGDQPMVPGEIIDQLIEEYHKTSGKIIIPVFEGKKGHPILIDLTYREKIMQLNPEMGLRELMFSHPEEIREFPVNTPDILNDIDTIEDYYIETSKRKYHETKD